MKLSEFKEYVIRNCSEDLWEIIEESYDYKVYLSNKEEQLEMLKQYPYSIIYINNPTEEMQLIAVKYDIKLIKYINNPTEKVLSKIMEDNNSITYFADLLRYIEKD